MAYFNLSEAIKRRLIMELTGFWAQDPKYRDNLLIHGKFSGSERAQQFIVLKGTSANVMRFSADNFQAVVISHCHLAKAYGSPGTSIEWVREDPRAIQRSGGDFPSPPGVYYVEVQREPYEHEGVTRNYLVFYVDSLLSVIDERPQRIDDLTFQTSRGAFVEGSLRVFELPGNLPLYEGVNFRSDPLTGRIALNRPLASRTQLSVDYYHVGEVSRGPFPVPENGVNYEAIPGVQLAFGRRAVEGDVMAVVITGRREDSAREYGGKFELSIDLEIMARDVQAQAEITDRTFMFLQAELRDRLSFEGVEIDSVTMGGETEESYDDNGGDYFYGASISMTVLTDWAVHVPFGPTLSRVIPGTLKQDQISSALTPDQLLEMGPNLGGIVATPSLGLVLTQDPYFRDRSLSFEMIR